MAAPETPATRHRRGRDRRVEGELANVGAAMLPPWEDFIGIALGAERVGDIFYGAATPEISYTRKVAGQPLELAFGVPLRFEIVDARPNERFEHAGRLRSEDWDTPSDFTRLIEQLTFGAKESHVFADVNAFTTTTLGHGTLLRRYNPHLDLNRTRVSAEVDGFTDFGGGELYLNDIAGPNILGGLFFIKPLSLIDREDSLLRSVSLGLTLVTDLETPVRGTLDVTDVDDDGRRTSELAVDQETFEPKALRTHAFAYGFDLEAKLVDLRVFDLKPYVDWSSLTVGLPTDEGFETRRSKVPMAASTGDGLTLGTLIRMNFGQAPVQAVRLVVEYRNYAPNYLPGYFDALYEVQSLNYASTQDSTPDALANGTKAASVMGRDPDGDRVHGGYLEATWRLGDALALAFGVETNTATADDSLFLHAEVPELGDWQLMTTYQRRRVSTFGELFDFSLGPTDYLLGTTRYGIADWLHARLDVLTPFGIGPDSLYRSRVQLNLGVELGWSY